MRILQWAVATACLTWTASAAVRHDGPLVRPEILETREEDLLGLLMKRQNVSAGSPGYNCHDNCGEPSILFFLLFLMSLLTEKSTIQAKPSSRSATAPRSTFATTPPSPPTTTTACSAPAPTTRTFGCTTAPPSTRRRPPVATPRRPRPGPRTAWARPWRRATRRPRARRLCRRRRRRTVLLLRVRVQPLLRHRLRYVQFFLTLLVNGATFDENNRLLRALVIWALLRHLETTLPR